MNALSGFPQVLGAFALGSLLAMTSGCGTSRVVSVPVTSNPVVATPGAVQPGAVVASVSHRVARWDGIYYGLPKTYLRFTVRFDLWLEAPWQKPEGADDAAGKDPAAAKREPVKTRYGVLILSDTDGLTVTPVLRRDPEQNYLLLSPDSSLIELSDYKLTLTPEGYLAALNATYEDKRAEVVSNVVGSAINMAKLLLKATPVGPDHAPLRAFSRTNRSFTYTFTCAADMIPRDGSATAVSLDNLTQAIASGGTGAPLFGKEIQALDTMIDNGEVPLDIRTSYPEFRWLRGAMPAIGKLPAISASLEYENGGASPNAVAVATQISNGSNIVPGVVYRVPLPAVVRLKVDGAPAVETNVDVYQLGYIGFKEVRSHAFSKRTEKLTFTNGAITEHEKAATSAAANATKLLADQVTNLKAAVEDIKTGRATAAAADLTRERDLQLEQVDLDAVNRQLDANQQKVDSAATPADKQAALAERDGLLKQKITLEAKIDALRRGLTLPAPAT